MNLYKYEEALYDNISKLPVVNKARNIYINGDNESVNITSSDAYNTLYTLNYDLISGEKYSLSVNE